MDALREQPSRPLTAADLAAIADFALGDSTVSPSRRTLSGPRGTADLQPRMMQVLVVLAERPGHVVARETLFERCWGDVYVGDDSLNRVVAALRRLMADVGGGFEIETVPKTGYRLTDARREPAAAKVRLTRRQIASAAVGVAAIGAVGGGLWWSSRRPDARFQQLIEGAEDAIRHERVDDATARMLRQAVSVRPDSARAWGLLALVRSILIDDADRHPESVTSAVREAEQTARKALSLDPGEPNALLAMFELEGSTLDWITRDHKLRHIVAIDPSNIVALTELTLLTAATGLVRESWYWNERALALEPLNRLFLGMRSMKLWVFGRVPDADKVIDQLRALYPDDPWVWFVRVQLYAFTGRVGAALGLLDSEPKAHGPSPLASLWRASLPAIDDPSPGNVEKARAASIGAVEASRTAANEAILIMSSIGELDTAFDIADGTLLSRGPLVPRQRPGAAQASENAVWRTGTQWMWAPPVRAMRADPRFTPLCEGVGLVEYWRRRGVQPDYMRLER
jgi:DNA-binding winged helix-turn-helix (wHTH) protein